MKKTTKVTISLDIDLLDQLDNYADDNGMTRSGLIGVACRNYLLTMEAQPSMLNMMKLLGDLAGKGAGMSEEQRAAMLRELDDGQQQLFGMLQR